MNIKKRKNSGISQIEDINIEEISQGASLKDNPKEKDNQKSSNKTHAIPTRLPEDFYLLIKDKIDKKQIIGSMTSYIVEATRNKLIKDGHLTDK